MATSDSNDIWKELRKPFDPKVIGQLPKAGIKLDYVGHAAVTDRLLSVDPQWTWEPVAFDERGLPQYDNAGGLWIRLTVGGVTRLGYGDGEDPKVRIGDALRNAAMRFGVALDLWTKDELESHLEHPELKNESPSDAVAAPTTYTPPLATPDDITATADRVAKPGLIDPRSMAALKTELAAKGMTGIKATEFAQFIINKDKPESESEVQELLASLRTGHEVSDYAGEGDPFS